MEYLKATWIGSDAGGHVSINGCEHFLDELRSRPGGGRVRRRGTVADGIVVTPCADDGDKKQIHEPTQTRLFAGEFMVQNTPKNYQVLKDHVKIGFIEMNDYSLQCEMEGRENAEPEITEQIVEKNVVIETDVSVRDSQAAKDKRNKAAVFKMQEANVQIAAEKKEKIAIFSVLKSVKMRKEEILGCVIEKGINTMEQLAAANKDVLLSISNVGEKVAIGMIEEAKALTGGSEEE